MHSHHFIGVGLLSQKLKQEALDPDHLIGEISRLVEECDLQIVSREAVKFENGGATLLWVLAESHLVIHFWADEGFATIDLHVCDYQASNRERAARLKKALSEFCFDQAEANWHEFMLPQPTCAVR
ncbi:MAG TPA: S-adenosylmethionine decarboxylase [Blastocatellia bacterium]|jgi:S-adenosylmethionine/arginine decarboxylase-like enzyme|nr:S-adenosylmethionine decarboxylase [Blastocatellia bacterium]